MSCYFIVEYIHGNRIIEFLLFCIRKFSYFNWLDDYNHFKQDSPPAWPQEAYHPRSPHLWTLTGGGPDLDLDLDLGGLPTLTRTLTRGAPRTLIWTLTGGMPPNHDPDLDWGPPRPWPGPWLGGAPTMTQTLTGGPQTLTWTLTRGAPTDLDLDLDQGGPQTLTGDLDQGPQGPRPSPGGPLTLTWTLTGGAPRPWLGPWPGGGGALWTDRNTENITFPQTSFAGGNKKNFLRGLNSQLTDQQLAINHYTKEWEIQKSFNIFSTSTGSNWMQPILLTKLLQNK